MLMQAIDACENKWLKVAFHLAFAATVRIGERKVYIPKFVAQILVDIKKEQDELKDILGSEYQDYNLVIATTFGLPIGDSYLRDQMQKVIDEQGLPDVVFHSLRHTSVTYKLKLSGGDIKAVQGDSGHAQADMVTDLFYVLFSFGYTNYSTQNNIDRF